MIKILIQIAVIFLLLTACKKPAPAPEPTPAPPVDTIKPLLTLNGKLRDTVSLNSTYNDAGAKAIDDTDGDISSRITVSGTVEKNRVGGNYLYYTVKDAKGNSSQATRYIYVRNDAYRFEGTYKTVSNCGGTFNGLNATSVVETSNMYNNRIILSNQQFQSSGFSVSADINGSSISMVVQPIASSLGSATGIISADMKSFTLTTSYNPAIQGSSGCTIVYTKQ